MNQKAGSSKHNKGSTSDFPGQKPTLVPPVLREVGKLAAGVAAVSTGTSSGSATGNLRNKYALQPGFSLMDWIRLGASGKDLTGVGAAAGQLSVTPTELAKHNEKSDAWLCIRGRVYNVTAYFPFHPGGPDELMRAVGKDATALFEQVHPWVNFEQILNKCYIGPLRTNIDITAEDLFGSRKVVGSSPQLKESSSEVVVVVAKKEPELPRFDWIQKLDYITVVFYTGAYSNPLVEIVNINNSSMIVNIICNGFSFENEINFANDVQWPCQTKIIYETGKVELILKKIEGSIWENYGVLRQKSREILRSNLEMAKFACKIINKLQINYNTSLIELQRDDGVKIITPIGMHVKVFDTIKGEDMSRSYTPVPRCVSNKFRSGITDTVCLMIKRYPDGNLSRMLTNCNIGDLVTISKPLGSFNLRSIEKRESFIMLAAGTGITPMFSIILFLLERRIRKCQSLRLLFFNKTEEDILCRSQFDDLAQEDSRFHVDYILSQAGQSWSGSRGHISRSMLEGAIQEHLKGTTYVQSDIYLMACGPTIFTTLAQQILNDLRFGEDQFHLFLG